MICNHICLKGGIRKNLVMKILLAFGVWCLAVGLLCCCVRLFAISATSATSHDKIKLYLHDDYHITIRKETIMV